MFKTIRYLNLEDIPVEQRSHIWDYLDKNGGNCISVQENSPFGQWLGDKGFEFSEGPNGYRWDWIVIFR